MTGAYMQSWVRKLGSVNIPSSSSEFPFWRVGKVVSSRVLSHMHRLKFEAQLELMIGPHQGHEAGSSACLGLAGWEGASLLVTGERDQSSGAGCPTLFCLSGLRISAVASQLPQQQLWAWRTATEVKLGAGRGEAGCLPANEPRLLDLQWVAGAFINDGWHGSMAAWQHRPHRVWPTSKLLRVDHQLSEAFTRGYRLQLVALQGHTVQ